MGHKNSVPVAYWCLTFTTAYKAPGARWACRSPESLLQGV